MALPRSSSARAGWPLRFAAIRGCAGGRHTRASGRLDHREVLAKIKRGPPEAERAERPGRSANGCTQGRRRLRPSEGWRRWLRARTLFHSYSVRTGLRSSWLDPFDLRQPGRCTLRVESCLDPIRTDGGNAPAAATFERCPQLLLTDGMRATGIRSDVTETEHVQVPATPCHGRQTRDVVSPLIAVERVEQPTIEHRLEDRGRDGSSSLRTRPAPRADPSVHC
jgi:hypothetical protein